MENIDQWFYTSVRAALYAGKEIMDVYHSSDFQVSLKEDQSPLTRADRSADETIRNILQKTPYPILSEESGQHSYDHRASWKDFWIVDPLDGTKEFISRNDEFTVNIALIQQGKPVFGVIYTPVVDQLYIGIPNKGAWRIDQAKQHIQTSTDLESLIGNGVMLPQEPQQVRSVVVSKSHLSEATLTYLDNLESSTGSLDRVSAGSSLKLCRIAEGSAGIYPRFGPTMEWDIAAGVAIVEASGGTITTHEGKPLHFNKTALLNPWFIAVSRLFSDSFPSYL